MSIIAAVLIVFVGGIFTIVVHELGHFLTAKFFGVAVQEFTIGFGRVLYKKQIGETLFSLRLWPIGGGVKIPNSLRNLKTIREVEECEQLSKEEKDFLIRAGEDRWFTNKPLFVKLAIMLAGVTVNVVVALIFFLMYMPLNIVDPYGSPRPVIAYIKPNSLADKVGLKEGDRIVKINGIRMFSWYRFATFIDKNQGKRLKLLVRRQNKDGKRKALRLTLTLPVAKLTKDDIEVNKEVDITGIESLRVYPRLFPHHIGIYPITKYQKVPFLKVVLRHSYWLFLLGKGQLMYLISILSDGKPLERAAGPVTVVKAISTDVKKHGTIEELYRFFAMFNIGVVFLNLIPMLPLDGGVILVIILSYFLKERLNLKLVEQGCLVGILIIAFLTVLGLTKDVTLIISQLLAI
ncbi:MAG: hypothetical protein D6780_07940, partial [Candidatus Dadabacteria bacterium]